MCRKSKERYDFVDVNFDWRERGKRLIVTRSMFHMHASILIFNERFERINRAFIVARELQDGRDTLVGIDGG